MSFLSGLLGNASQIDPKSIQNELQDFLIQNESIQQAFKLIRDMFVFTNYRLIFIDKQGMTGKRTEFISLPYKHISHFSIETAGHLDIDSRLNIYMIGHDAPIAVDFKGNTNLQMVHRTLAHYALNAPS